MSENLKTIQSWLVPHFDPREHNPREGVMLKEWREYMSYQDWHTIGWSTRLEVLLSNVPRAGTLRGGRVATTAAVWFMTPVGKSVLEDVLEKTKKNSFFLEHEVVKTWAFHNRLSSGTINILEHLLFLANKGSIYKNPPYPTMEDNRVVERVLIFLAEESGRSLLKRVCEKVGEPKLFPL